MYFNLIVDLTKKYWYEAYIYTTGTILASAGTLANTVFLDKYTNIFSMYEDAQPMPIHPRINLLFKKVIEDLEIPEKSRPLYQPFMFVAMDTYLLGASYYKSGVRVGIPLTYAYDKTSEINSAKIYVCHDVVDWSRPASQIFLKTLIMPEEAKKFAIAREIINSQSFDSFRNLISYPVFFIIANCSYMGLYNKYNFVKRPVAFRGLVYAGLAVTCGIAWLIQDNFFTYRKERKTNEKLAKLGPEYVKGGFQFYDHILQRNMALRHLMDEESKNVFTDRGEQNSKRYVFMELLISKRRNFFAAKLKEIINETSSTIQA